MGQAEMISAAIKDGKAVVFPNSIKSAAPKKKKSDTPRAARRNQKVDPIRSQEDIDKIIKYFVDRKKYRDCCMFVVGIQYGLRAGDLVSLQIKDVMNDDGKFNRLAKKEHKTGNMRYLFSNSNVEETIRNYIETIGEYDGETYLFSSRKTIRSKKDGETDTVPNNHIEAKHAWKILKAAQRDLKLPYNIGTHTMRKTFGYHVFMNNQDFPYTLAILQNIYGHSSEVQTRKYIGLTEDMEKDIYMNLNLGKMNPVLDK